MNAFGNPIGSTGGVQREQTMEEILASIRKIIESNEAIANPSTIDFDEPVLCDANETVTNEAFTHQPAQAEAPVLAPHQIDVPLTIEQAPERVETQVPSLQSEMARLVSQSPERRVAAAFDDLNSAFLKSKQMPMEDVAEAMLRPMLKDWLDNNLPNLVERLVREEISRIARGDI